ncbi:protein NRT1/ PTR FAMILY 5.11-like [Papaver somniferum]|nr:protein NRT1/ PTR FAMILY 5.11-like [Papaver somniferum]
MYGIVYSTGETFFQDLVGSADTSSMGNANVYIMMLQSITKTSRLVIDHLVYRVLSRRSRTGTLATLIRMGLGMFFSIGTCTIAQYTEAARLTAVENKTNIPVALYIPQFIALGFVTGLAGEGLKVFFQNEYSNWINFYATTITEVLTGMGTLLNTVLVLALRLATKKKDGRGPWDLVC